MALQSNQLPDDFRGVIDSQIEIFKQSRSIQNRNSVPPTDQIPLDDPKHWIKIPDVICVFVDMKGSTQLSANTHDKETAGAYQLFTGTAVRLFDAFGAAYIDVRGDGVFGLFNKDAPYRALAAAITFKTFAHEEFAPRIKSLTNVEVGSHLGIDQKTVLVKKLGMRRIENRTDRQNEVWAGKPINMASKLASMSDHNQLIVSDRFFKRITHELVRKSCGCPNGQKVDLWSEIDLTDKIIFDFDKAWSLRTIWCKEHGKEYCNGTLGLDA